MDYELKSDTLSLYTCYLVGMNECQKYAVTHFVSWFQRLDRYRHRSLNLPQMQK